jgi:hypothetical protein
MRLGLFELTQMKLHFEPKDVEKLIQHTYAAQSHKVLYGNKATAKPGLWLVGDDGVYLMSNGIPSIPKGNNTNKQFVVYADECNPDIQDFDEWWEVKNATFGPDDGCEFIDLERINYEFGHKLLSFKVECTATKLNVVFEQQEPVKKLTNKTPRKIAVKKKKENGK